MVAIVNGGVVILRKEMDFSIALSAMFGRFGRGHVLT